MMDINQAVRGSISQRASQQLERDILRGRKMTRRDRDEVEDDLKNYEAIRRTFEGLEDKVLVFSSCNIGKRNGLAQHISRVSGAKAVITYDRSISDAEASLSEASLYFSLACHENE